MPKRWAEILPAVSYLYQLIPDRCGAYVREGAARRHSRPFDTIADFFRVAQPMDWIAGHLFAHRKSSQFRRASRAICAFITHYLTMIYRQQVFTDKEASHFYRATRRHSATSPLLLLYVFLDPLLCPPTGTPPIGIMDTAEASVLPADGWYCQVTYTLDLDEHGFYMKMAPEQIFALRPAYKIWRQLRHSCARCLRKLRMPRRQCSGCGRAYYCSSTCQRDDWKNHGHRSLCIFWRRVNEGLQGREARMLAASLSVDRYRNIM
ncbi:hypothetical protein PENSPDRAFT_695059 [Peniophora sp. CONT]|nr:hypothetical protein PENSPDRAFT_695059 [Peniophora sp. CONT]